MPEFSIIGATGLIASGKSFVLEHLETLCRKEGTACLRLSLSDEIRAEAVLQEGLLTREILTQVGNSFRQRYGGDYWVRRCLQGVISPGFAGVVLLDSFRHEAEVYRCRAHWGRRFRLLAVQAPLEVRWRRVQARKRQEDEASGEAIRGLLEEELTDSPEAWGLHVATCLSRADFTVDGSLPWEVLYGQLQPWFERLRRRGEQ